jgi:hypothetical protein
MESRAIRTVLVAPETGARESYWVTQAMVLIALGSVVLASWGASVPPSSEFLDVYQRPFRDETPARQAMYRELASGLEDAIRMRTPGGDWPAVEALRAELVPPFQGDTDYRWEFRSKGGIRNYLGVPREGSGKPAWLLLIQENVPHPGPVVMDEFHRKCLDGSLIHVGIWVNPAPKDLSGVIYAPEREGWSEIVLGSSTATVK